MGRETPTTAHQTPTFPTAAMMDLEDSCPLLVRTLRLFSLPDYSKNLLRVSV